MSRLRLQQKKEDLIPGHGHQRGKRAETLPLTAAGRIRGLTSCWPEVNQGLLEVTFDGSPGKKIQVRIALVHPRFIHPSVDGVSAWVTCLDDWYGGPIENKAWSINIRFLFWPPANHRCTLLAKTQGCWSLLRMDVLLKSKP